MNKLKNLNFGKISLVMSILGGVASLIGGVAATVDAKATAIKTAEETTKKYLESKGV